MAERRMFAKTIIDSDAFLDMPLSAQALYFHLSMRADDEGFINNPRKIQRMIGASDDDIKILEAKNFVIPFESGVVVIKHWRIHNYIRSDRLVETKYKEERSLLEVKSNGAYTISNEILPLEDASCEIKRKRAYENSTLPYSFTYKIRHAFEKHICPVCGKTMTSAYKNATPSVQHNFPIVKGGEHELGNISVICLECNVSIRDKETGELNNAEVIEVWDKIVYAETHNIKWFDDSTLLDEIDVRQMSDTCQTNVSIGKDSIGKVSINKNYSVHFDEFWNAYPRKKEKANAYKCYQARLKDGYSEEELLTACKNYAAECQSTKREERYIKLGSTFLSSATPFVDYLKGAEHDTGVGTNTQSDEERDAEIRRYLESDEFKNWKDEDLF